MTKRYRFTSIDTDYFQFHLHDVENDGSLADAWTPEALARNLAVAPFIIGVGTQRNTAVWLDVEVQHIKPEAWDSKHWSQIIECSLELPSGNLAISSPTLNQDDYKHVLLAPGTYRLRMHYGKQKERGSHRYKIILWENPTLPVVILSPKPEIESSQR